LDGLGETHRKGRFALGGGGLKSGDLGRVVAAGAGARPEEQSQNQKEDRREAYPSNLSRP